MRYRLNLLKRMLEDILIFPFVAWGSWRASKEPLGDEYEIFFFFPFYHVGGAEKVHASLTRAFADKKAIIIFTRKSVDDGFLSLFQSSGHRILDISAHTDSKWKYWLNLVYRGRFSHYINQQKRARLVLNGQCNFAYKLSPWINSHVPQVELIHSFNSFSYIRIPFIPFYDATVMISRKRIDDHLKQYETWGVPNSFKQKIHYIINGIDLPEVPKPRNQQKALLRFLYAGRATPEKRVHWIAHLAGKSRELNLPLEFAFMGDVKNEIPQSLHSFCIFLGNLNDAAKIAGEYQLADVVVLASSTEGFPMVVEEGMSWGCAILATPVGDIPAHVRAGENGYLFDADLDENGFIAQGIEFIRMLVAEPLLLSMISANNIRYAREHFGFEKFKNAWRHLLEEVSLTKNNHP